MNRNWSSWAKEQNIIIPTKPLIIQLEGVDGAGKTTILEILRDIIKHSMVFHTSAPPKDLPIEYYSLLLTNLYEISKEIKQPLFIDRFHIGELVYGSIFRPHTLTKVTKSLLWGIDDDASLNNKTKIIYVKASEKVIKERLNKRGDWLVSDEHITPILEKYEEVLAKTKLPIFVWDTSNGIKTEDVLSALKFISSEDKIIHG